MNDGESILAARRFLFCLAANIGEAASIETRKEASRILRDFPNRRRLGSVLSPAVAMPSEALCWKQDDTEYWMGTKIEGPGWRAARDDIALIITIAARHSWNRLRRWRNPPIR